MKINSSIFMLCIIFLVGCARTEYKPFEESNNPSVGLSRTVNFYLNSDINNDPPQCVLVFLPRLDVTSEFLMRIENMLVRHLSEKFPKIISGKSRDTKAAKYAFDLAIHSDRHDFAKEMNCGSVFEFQIFQPKHQYMFVWSEIRIGLEARLFRQRDGSELWKARHIARRSEGGISITPLGITANAFEANRLSSDPDAFESVADDLVRRVMKSMPNMKFTPG
jgi:hypothetical protein